MKEGIEKNKEAESLLKSIITENFPNLEKDINIRYRKFKDHQSDSTQIGIPQDIL